MRHLLLQLLVLLVTLAHAAPAAAQVNIEKYRMDPGEEGVAGSLSVGFAAKTGNVDTFESSISGTAAAQVGEEFFLLVVSGKYAAKRTGDDRLEEPEGTLFESDARYANALLGALRYNHPLSDVVTWELFSQLEYDEFLSLDLRSLGGTGLRLTLAQTENASAWLGTGYMMEYERLAADEVVEDPVTLAHRWTSYFSFKVEPLDRVYFASTTYVQPRIGMFWDYRILDESELSFAVTDHFSFGVTLKLRHDSDPPELEPDEPPLQPTDVAITNSISITF